MSFFTWPLTSLLYTHHKRDSPSMKSDAVLATNYTHLLVAGVRFTFSSFFLTFANFRGYRKHYSIKLEHIPLVMVSR